MVSPSSPTHEGSRRPATVIATLMPHMAAGRHHVYRNGTALALLAALVAAGLGSLSVALVLTAVALPAMVLIYVHDHRLWRDEPLTVIVVTFGLSLLLGVGVGLLETHFIRLVAAAPTGYHLPPVSRILELGVFVPVVALVAVMVAPLLVSARPAFRHPMDAVVACSLSGAALSFGLSVVIERGAFAHVQATAGDPAHVAFIALTLGFLQPIVLATAATVAVLGLRRWGINPVAGVMEGLALLVAYELATTLLQPYGARGIVLTTLVAFVLAGAGLMAARDGLHAAMLADGQGGPDAGNTEGAGPVDHRLHAAVVAAIIAVVVLIAAAVTVAVVWGGASTHPTPSPPGRSGGIVSGAAAAIHPTMSQRDGSPLGNVDLASTTTSLAVGPATAIDLGNGVTLTPAPRWTIFQQGPGWAVLLSDGEDATMYVDVGKAKTPEINQEATQLINAAIQKGGMTNVQQNPLGSAQTVQGKNFQQVLQISYTASVQTDLGTQQEYGTWATLFNPSTQIAGFVELFGYSPQDFQAAVPDGKSMLASMF
ncbi:zinc ribbon domain-containing protein [Mycobacterium malmoense]|uniref:zinc ribbon domain-containing protein n=1 Tax=Mycobacterium malmoense TaxID=1780 RepID=UPI000A9740C8|nr:zinc ribbon domain-containing protein [Mycobacterium malmoense]QZA15585.1 zinc ribbon domain-containing protein [Mycobacterium malmoense]UNB92400.1 zinc ribbon domain-containing protein [Mycobacterium malmoense]